jgi:protein involved in polysaccharide export with SLBB domain
MNCPVELRRLQNSARDVAVVVVVILLLCATPCEALTQIASSPPPGPIAEAYLIQIGDQLDIKFFYNPTLNEQVTVRPDGRISLQLIQEVTVVGLTAAALTAELIERYSVDLRQPQVTVIVRGFGAQRVFVDGEVGRPGMVPILGPVTVLQAIAQAGGLKNTARESEIIVIRRNEANAPVARQINLKKALNGSDARQDISLAPFDIVFVPRSRMSNVNVWMDHYIRQNIPIPFGLQYGLVK